MKTPRSSRLHISIFGDTNAGKSALFNAIAGSSASIVSDVAGTTTDPVSKSMELIPFGPIVLTDTAGLSDITELGRLRMAKTEDMLSRTDLAVYCIYCEDYDKAAYERMADAFAARDIPYITVMTKRDLFTQLPVTPENAVWVSVYDRTSIENLKNLMVEKLNEISGREAGLLSGLELTGRRIAIVAPFDSEAPKGRLILPQVQVIRECLDNGFTAIVTTPDNLPDTLAAGDIALVITDSQAFAQVSQIVPDSILLTSFSILTARQKGRLFEFVKGAETVNSLKDGSKVLIAEACSHSHNHEDIGRVKIPAALKRLTGKDISFDFAASRDFSSDLAEYDLVVHCGGCMMTRREMISRINTCGAADVPVTNYGVLLALASGILPRSVQPFRNELDIL